LASNIRQVERENHELKFESLDKFNVVIMPDLFIDRIAKLPSFEIMLEEFKKKSESGGGSIRAIEQKEIRGGNATNVAYALGKLGISVDLIVVADKNSEPLLRGFFSNLHNVNIEIINGKPGYTIALEFQYKGRLVNIMLNDVGDISKSRPDQFNDEWWKKLSKSELVGIFNWGSNMKGSELAIEVFSKASDNEVKTYFAPADLSERLDEVPHLFKNLRSNLNILSVNENEARIIAKTLHYESLPISYEPEDIIKSAKDLSDNLGMCVDIHTKYGSSSSINGETSFVKSFKVKQNIATGAGDVWDASNIVGYLLDLDPERRLKLANASSAKYISGEYMEAPSINEVSTFISKN
jgi:ribokinase